MATGQGRGAMFLVLSLVGGMLVTTYVYQLIRGFDTRLENAQRPKTTTEIVVAKKDLLPGLTIREEDLIIEDFNRQQLAGF